MFIKRNLVQCITLFSCSGTFVCVLLNYLTNISPIGGVWFLLYILSLFFASVWISFKFIQWLLRMNKPLKYHVDGMIQDYPYLSSLWDILPDTRRKDKQEAFADYDTNELSVISTVLEKKLVSSWYVPYISQEISFPFACKQMLDQMISKTFQICNKIETKDVYIDLCTILTLHLKEYKKALKRHEKSPKDSVESLYKKTHPVSDVTKQMSSADHCNNLVRIVLKELVPWEMWDTPHSELLVRILSKKLDNFIDNTLSDPVWLNDKLLTLLVGDVKTDATVIQQKDVPEMTKPDSVPYTVMPDHLLQNTISEDVDDEQKEKVQAIRDQKNENIVEEVTVTSESVDKTSPLLRQRRGRQGKNEVKIYDRIIEGSVKTWETDMDLQCISLGQDLLASLDGEITLSRLWGQDGSPNPPRATSPPPLWFGEEDTLDMDLDTSPQRECKKEQSPKPGDALLKDIQSTVSQAKTKIGDLQVRNVNIDVCKRSSDEAAGMMEGLLDFGIAGLKKGLRFTGLSDDSQEKSPPCLRQDKTPPDTRIKKITEHRDVVTTSLLQKEEYSSSAAPPLLKQQRVISQDSVPSQPKPIIRGEFPPPPVPLSDSPEPQYEEVADLSTSIAKLRSLLQQRAQTQRNDDIWWESAEETRGRTQHHNSSRPVDTATLADEYDMNTERNSSPGLTSNNMQRLDKLFQRTVTGVFNSIKTAVGAEGEESSPARPLHDWVYVSTAVDHTVGCAVGRAVGARRALAHVDAALDSLDQLAAAPAPTRSDHTPEDFEEWCSAVCACWSATHAAAHAAGLAHAHVTHRIATLLFADLAELLINVWLDHFTCWLKKQVFVFFEQMSGQEAPSSNELRQFHLDETCKIAMDKLPDLYIFGEETFTNAVKFTISSFTHKELNRDVIYRVLDLLALHFKKSAGVRNPSFDGS